MASLTGNTIQSTYDSLLKVTDNDSITGSLKRITDGLGNNTPLYLSSSAVEIVSTLNVTSTITASNLSGTNTGDETKASIETKLGAATSSNSGYLTSTDWSTFNNKIAGTGTLNKLAKFSSSSSIADSTITDTGSAVTIGVATSVTGSLTASSLIKSGGTSSQILAADGSVITAGTNITISGGTISASGGISGSGTAGRVPRFITASSLGDSNIYTAADETIGLMTGIGASPNGAPTPHILYVSGNTYLNGTLTSNAGITAGSFIRSGGTAAQILAANGSVITAGTNITISGGTISANNTSQWITSGSNIYYNTGNVGIGTTSPSNKLSVVSSVSTTEILASFGTLNNSLRLAINSDGSSEISNGAAVASIHISQGSNKAITITDTRNVGIGTTSPASKLNVSGDNITVSAGYGIAWAGDQTRIMTPEDNVSGALIRYGSGGIMRFVNGSTEHMRISGSGNVGIGTTSPVNYSGYNTLTIAGNTSGGVLAIRNSSGYGGNLYASANGFQIAAIDATRSILFETADTERMRINTNGNVSIGNTIADSFDIFGRRLVIGAGGGTEGITVYSGTSSGGGLLFADGTTGSAPYRGFVTYNHSTDTLSLGAGGDARMRIDSGGFVSVGGSTTYNTSRVNIEVGTDQSGITTNVNSSDNRYHLYFRNTLSTVGSISTNTYATSFNTSSDYRLKEDLKTFNGLSILKDIKVYDFKWKGVEDRNYGVVAHEIAEVIPYAVNGEKDGKMHQSVDYSKLVPVLIQAIQELKAELDELKNK